MDKKDISLQVYTARHFKPYEDIFKFLSQQGMNKVELFEVEAFSETKKLLEIMKSPTCFIGLKNPLMLFSGSITYPAQTTAPFERWLNTQVVN